MGSLIFARQPTEEDYRGARFARHPHASRTAPRSWSSPSRSMIEDIHRAYLEAGADIIETYTFNGNALSLAEFGLEDHVFEINKTAAELARRAADDDDQAHARQAALRRRQHRADQQVALDGRRTSRTPATAT